MHAVPLASPDANTADLLTYCSLRVTTKNNKRRKKRRRSESILTECRVHLAACAHTVCTSPYLNGLFCPSSFLIECYLVARARSTRSRHTSSLPCTHGDLAPLPQDLPVKPESPSFLRPSTSSFFSPIKIILIAQQDTPCLPGTRHP